MSSVLLTQDSTSSSAGVNLKWSYTAMSVIKEISLIYFKNVSDADIQSKDIPSGLLRCNLDAGFDSGQSYSYQLQCVDTSNNTVYSNTLVLTTPYFLVAPSIASFSGGDASLTVQLESTSNILSASDTTVEFVLKRADNVVFWIIKPYSSGGSYVLSSYDNGALTNNVAYRVACMYQPLANNSRYASASVMSASISATPSNLPNAPASVSSVTSGTTTLAITVNWTRPSDFSEWSAGGYSIKLSLFGPPGVPTQYYTITNQDLLTYKWDNLLQASNYSAFVQYSNAFGDGPIIQNAQGFIFPTRIADAPTLVSASDGDTQSVLVWSPNFTGQSAITAYQLYRNGQQFASVGPTVLTYTYTGMVNGFGYNFSVKAVNAIGESVSSNYILSNPRGQMSIVSVVASGKTLTVVINPNGVAMDQVLLVALDTDPNDVADGGFVVSIPKNAIAQDTANNVTVIKTFSGFSSDIAFWCAIAHNGTNSAYLKSA